MLTRSISIQNVVLAVLLTALMAMLPAWAEADELRGTADEAQAMVASAITFYDENGRDAAFAAFEDKDGAFVDHDLYIFIYGPGRTIDAHGADVNLNGTPVDTLIDINGKPFGTALMDEATAEGVWVEYTWYNPVTRELHPKSSWVVRHDEHVFGAGIYLPEGVESGADAEDDPADPPVVAELVAEEADEMDAEQDVAEELMEESMDEMMDESADELLQDSVDEMGDEIAREAEDEV
jgi:signal transduction histidine kinase